MERFKIVFDKLDELTKNEQTHKSEPYNITYKNILDDTKNIGELKSLAEKINKPHQTTYSFS